MNALFAMPGGKNFQKKLIIPKFPDHEFYIEPFVGGGSIFFNKPRCKREVINDGDESIAFFYQYIQSHKDFPEFPVGKVTREKFEYWKALDPKNDDQRFLKIFILQQYSFRGNRKSYSPSRGEGMLLKNIIFLKNYSFYHERLQGVTVCNMDYKALLKKYDSPEAFVYLDPPYETGTESDVSNASDEGDWYGTVSIADINQTVRSLQGKWMLSFSDNKELRSALKDFHLESYKTHKISTRNGMKA